MEFKEFKEKVSNFLIQNYNFEMKSNFLTKKYLNFQFVICIVKSSFGKHYKILSNVYVPELHSYEKISSMKNCEKIIHEDVQTPEDLFSKEFLSEKTEEEIFVYIKKFFDIILEKLNKEGIKYFSNKKEAYLYSNEFQKFLKC